VTVELIEVGEASRNMLHKHWKHVCLSRLRTDEKITPSTRTWFDAVTVSELIWRDKPLTVLRTCPQQLCLIRIQLKAVCRHPMADLR